MAFVRVTAPELAQTLRDNGPLYEQPYDEDTPTPIEWGGPLETGTTYYTVAGSSICS